MTTIEQVEKEQQEQQATVKENAKQVAACIDAIASIYENGNKQNEIICFALLALVVSLDETADFYYTASLDNNEFSDEMAQTKEKLFDTLDKIAETKQLNTNTFQLRLANNVLTVSTPDSLGNYATHKTTKN